MLYETTIINVKLEIFYKTVNQLGERIGPDIPQVPEFITHLPVELSKDGDVILVHIITQLSTLGYRLDEAEIWFYSNDYKDYVHCGRDPLPRIMVAKGSDLENNCLKIKARIEIPNIKEVEESKSDETSSNVRVKERELAVIIKKVKKWRDLYRGYPGKGGKRINYSLEDAASFVNLPKKTLDDYLQQLKLGKKYGFDFNENQHERVGVLREFIKEKSKNYQNDPKLEKKPMEEIGC